MASGMSPLTFVLYGLLAAAVVFVVWAGLQGFWRGVGIYRIRRAGPRPLQASRHRMWNDPGPVEQLDLGGGPGGREGAPVAPFTFIEEHSGGSQPCVSVRDARGRRWRAKWGSEVNAETFAVRLAWACGYYGEVTHFVRSGTVEHAVNLQRASRCIDAANGRFADARFELDDPAVKKLFEEHSWSWNDNPFVGTRELDGLKILVMLLSNWDTKDRRDVARGSNTAIFEVRTGRRPWGHREARYLITDWGGSMGKWGTSVVSRGRWDPAGFEAQTVEFVTGTADGMVSFGYAGQRTADIVRGITIEHARWFHEIAGRIRDAQLVDALAASGATDEEQTRFARALLTRIHRLGEVTRSPG
jgi:hypothetical protein